VSPRSSTGAVVPTAEQRRVLDWAAANRRDLPWRRTRDPWRVLVAEVMLQQTQADRVVAHYEAFTAAYPDPAACAAAPLAEVLRAWAGLGYPRRARNLRRTAQLVVAEHGGRLPEDLSALLALPGIGPYTARAVLAFAFERDVAVVDTNTGRVLARRAGERLTPARAQAAADAWVPAGHGWAWNQGLLDLGALRCRPTDPQCVGCPVRRTCAWARAEWPDPDPARRSAGVSVPQSRFAGSARQARGRLLRALGDGPVPVVDVAATIGWVGRDASEVDAVVVSLVADGLVHRRHGRLHLGGG
jgi:A/G-specific adenine glycosylase